MKRVLLLVCLIVVLSACRPYVENPARWDPTTYCRTVQQTFGPDAWCKAHDHRP